MVAPVPYGAITRGGMLTLELFAFSTLALALLARPRLARLRGVALPIAATCAIALLGLMQLIPAPDFLLRILSPVSASIYANAATTLHAFGRSAPVPRISIAPAETYDTILLTLAYVALFVAAVLLLRSRTRRRLFAVAFLGSALLQILIASATRSTTAKPDELAFSGRLHGAFVNPNHFAGYLLLPLAIAFGVLWRDVLHQRTKRTRPGERARRFESSFMRISWRIVLWAVVAAGIGVTQSRAGILAAIITTVVLLVIAPSHPRIGAQRLSYGAAGAGVVAAAVGFTILAVRQQPIIRFLGSDPRDPASDLRLTLWRLSFDAWRNFPLFGSGLGTYREAFRRVQPRDLDYLVEFAHSDPLQLLVTGGIVGLALGTIAFAALAAALYRRWHAEPRREESAFLLAAFGAVVALTLHGLVEFNMSIPAIPATLACVAGFGWAAAHGEQEDEERRALRLVKT